MYENYRIHGNVNTAWSLKQAKMQSIPTRHCHKHNFYRDKSFVMTKHVFCRDKRCSQYQQDKILSLAGAATSIIFIVTKVLLWQNMSFVATKVCLQQQKFCHDKQFCHDKVFLSFVATNNFVTTKIFLSWQTCVCHDKTFVATKIILVAAPTSDIIQPFWANHSQKLRIPWKG